MNSVEKDLIKKYGIVKKLPKTELLDISETISELSYLTHSHFRYYGKFPSKLASYFLERYSTDNSVLLDNYVGSGTSLVEAKLKGIPSYGIDINPLAVLASNVKTCHYDKKQLEKYYNDIKDLIYKDYKSEDLEYYTPDWSSLGKWFTEQAVTDLSIIKKVISEYNFSTIEYKEFFLLAFLGIIRRVSVAYDGEVRPHVNKSKRVREIKSAFLKKAYEMIMDSAEFSYASNSKTKSVSFIGTNTDLEQISPNFTEKINLVLSHPPYLNCFDYLPVFNLELQWSIGLPEVWQDFTLKEIKGMETKSWPATNESILYGYFDQLKNSYQEVFNVLDKNSVCGIVIGDSTINGELIRVHKILAQICIDIGFEFENMVYRTTHYGTGKYSYKAKANYHGADEEKKDGIIILRKR